MTKPKTLLDCEHLSANERDEADDLSRALAAMMRTDPLERCAHMTATFEVLCREALDAGEAPQALVARINQVVVMTFADLDVRGLL